MLASTRSSLLLPAALLAATLAPLCHAAATATDPGVFEIDLIFPRNTTFSSSTVVPVVFALQNPDLAPTLSTSIRWDVYPSGNGNTLSGPGAQSGTIPVPSLNSSSSSPYLATGFMNGLVGIDDTWVFTWTVDTTNCSTSSSSSSGSSGSLTTQNTGLYFTTNHSASTPDIVGATSSSVCHNTENFVFDIVGFQNTTASGSNNKVPTQCAILGTDRPSPNPCAVSINASQTSSIAASITASICKDVLANKTLYNVTCAASSAKPSSGAAGSTRQIGGEWVGLASVLLLAMCAGMALVV